MWKPHILCKRMSFMRVTILVYASFNIQYCSIQISYSLSNYVEDESVYHMMPLQMFTTFALHNFIEWIDVKHFTWLVEDLAEFLYPLQELDHLVNVYYNCTVPMFQVLQYLHISMLLSITHGESLNPRCLP